MAIHGNKSQTARTKALADFKKGELQVLVATDIAARGIDIDQLPHVVNFELPNVPEDYVHRIGRTGRAGSPGEAISLVSVDENGFLRDIERLIKHEIPKEIIPGFAPPAHERPEPIVLGRMVIGEGAGRGGARPRRDGPGRGDSGRSSHGGPRGNGGGARSRPWRQRQSRQRRRRWQRQRAMPTAIAAAPAAMPVAAATATRSKRRRQRRSRRQRTASRRRALVGRGAALEPDQALTTARAATLAVMDSRASAGPTTALLAGATGLVGRALLARLLGGGPSRASDRAGAQALAGDDRT